MKYRGFLFFLLLMKTCLAQQPSAESLLNRIDENQISKTKIITSSMIIAGRRGTRTIRSKSWITGQDSSFTEYLAPARERGTKMLKLRNDLWTYSPSTDRIIRISGHMLRQSVMGSDLSYEDMMEERKLSEEYAAVIIASKMQAGRDCWVVELTARTKAAAYNSRKIWVDKKRFIVLREDRFSKSGRLLKTTEIIEVFRQNGRWLAKRIIFKDVLKRGKGTEFVLDSIQFGADIPAYIFSKAALKK